MQYDQGACFLAGLGFGAGLMYLLDPNSGRRRRALVRDQMVHAGQETEDFLEDAWKDAQHRATGLAAETSAMFKCDHTSDEVLVDRVRSHLGRHCSHPHAIRVSAEGGHVTLSGPILERDLCGVIRAVRNVRGVRCMENHLDVHESPGAVAGLQGEPRHARRRTWMSSNWSPSTRLVAGMTGGALLGYGMTQSFPSACLLGSLGTCLLTRSIINQPIVELCGAQGQRFMESLSGSHEIKLGNREKEREQERENVNRNEIRDREKTLHFSEDQPVAV